MRTLHRLPLLARRPRAEICASAEFASFLLVPPPHTYHGCRRCRMCDPPAERGLTAPAQQTFDPRHRPQVQCGPGKEIRLLRSRDHRVLLGARAEQESLELPG